jgi:pilus assembly protein FimV
VESTSLDVNAAELDEDFNFDFEDDLDLADALPNADTVSESLDVAADDFNLDMDVDDVDLAALDHEMESLDVDFDGELGLDEEPAIVKLEATEIAKEDEGFGLDLDGDMLSLQDENGVELLAEDIGSTKLVLTDDLDNAANVEFASLNEEFKSLDEELAELDEQPIDLEFTADADEILGFELDSETPSTLDNVDDLQAFAESLEMNDLHNADQQTPEAPVFEQPTEEDQEEDLFAEALSDFGTESDELDIDAYSSDESTLADLSDEEMDSELDFLADADEAATKLDLARAYIDMGDTEGAKDILSEVVNEGSNEQRKEATELLGRIV